MQLLWVYSQFTIYITFSCTNLSYSGSTKKYSWFPWFFKYENWIALLNHLEWEHLRLFEVYRSHHTYISLAKIKGLLTGAVRNSCFKNIGRWQNQLICTMKVSITKRRWFKCWGNRKENTRSEIPLVLLKTLASKIKGRQWNRFSLFLTVIRNKQNRTQEQTKNYGLQYGL